MNFKLTPCQRTLFAPLFLACCSAALTSQNHQHLGHIQSVPTIDSLRKSTIERRTWGSVPRFEGSRGPDSQAEEIERMEQAYEELEDVTAIKEKQLLQQIQQAKDETQQAKTELQDCRRHAGLQQDESSRPITGRRDLQQNQQAQQALLDYKKQADETLKQVKNAAEKRALQQVQHARKEAFQQAKKEALQQVEQAKQEALQQVEQAKKEAFQQAKNEALQQVQQAKQEASQAQTETQQAKQEALEAQTEAKQADKALLDYKEQAEQVLALAHNNEQQSRNKYLETQYADFDNQLEHFVDALK